MTNPTGQLDLQVITPWMTLFMSDGTEDTDSHPLVPSDPAKHQLLREHALRLMDEHCPWLRRVLVAAQAQVIVDRGHFCIAMPSDPFDWIEVPGLSMHLHLMPWGEDGESLQ